MTAAVVIFTPAAPTIFEQRTAMQRTSGFIVLGILIAFAARADAQSDLTGRWASRMHEDQPHRIPGPALGDYTGLPINDAARLKARSWDASILSQPEQQAKPHPAPYSMRGPTVNFRMSEIIDPLTNQMIGYRITGLFGGADRTIWMDGRPHPSPLAEHTWDGFSTGEWIGPTLKVTTTHMKAGVLQRNGVPTSVKATMTEFFVRHDNHLLMMSIVDDPVYLEEPMVRTSNWILNPTQAVPLPAPFEIVDEVADRPVGYVPHYPLGTVHREFAAKYHIPIEAAEGGRETLYPEYAAKMKQAASDRSAGGAAR